MKRLFSLEIFLFVVLIFGSVPVKAAGGFSFSLAGTEAAAGETVTLRMNASGSVSAAAFRLRISYDETVLRFESVQTSAAIAAGTMRTNAAGGSVCAVYACDPNGKSAPRLSGTAVTFVFRVLDDAPAGETAFSVRADEVCGYDGSDLGMDAEQTLSLSVRGHAQPTEAPKLKTLVPSSGDLTPPFSPEVFDYALRVDPEVSSVAFRTETVGGAAVKASRSSLFAAGKETPILITVSSADKKIRTSYLVTVLRAAKDSKALAAEEKTVLGRSAKERTSLAAQSKAASAASSRKTSSVAKTLSASSSQGGSQVPVAPAAVTLVQNSFPAWLGYSLAAALLLVVGVLAGLLAGRKKK